MTTMLEFDAEAARQIEAVYLTADIVQQRREVLRLLGLTAGEAALDIGTGPGLLATDMAQAVGPAGRVCGIDVSDSMLTLARRRAVPASSAQVEYCHGGAVRPDSHVRLRPVGRQHQNVAGLGKGDDVIDTSDPPLDTVHVNG